ncbi:hypothetical protein N7481_008084 [Penicillium waksmanii]|uniref:uncharacterized protein n=1 Tax=Penicillium waksmanii TaxID=69791 RepID=UPI00254697B4|nr:uncharacterized protein N7481_008084 [Penicillium waksmanii]KAJ5980786.1 hypothetical protein N7481_008084 [Penicillium waksmanii]
MRPAYLLVALAPAVFAESQPHPQPRANDLVADLAHRSAVASIPEFAPREQLVPLVDPLDMTLTRRSARHVVQARSEGSLGQTPWIGCAIGLTCTALAAVMLG